MESIYSEWMPFGVTTHQMSTTPKGGIPPNKNLWPLKLILFILSDVEKFAEFSGEIIFQI